MRSFELFLRETCRIVESLARERSTMNARDWNGLRQVGAVPCRAQHTAEGFQEMPCPASRSRATGEFAAQVRSAQTGSRAINCTDRLYRSLKHMIP